MLKNASSPLPHGRGSETVIDTTALTEPCASASGHAQIVMTLGLAIYLASVIVVYVPFGVMSILCTFKTNLVSAFSSCLVTT